LGYIKEADFAYLEIVGEEFQRTEEKGVLKELESYYNLYKAFLELRDRELILILMSERFYNHFFGALEWNPNYPGR
jgi:hypothetical protein